MRKRMTVIGLITVLIMSLWGKTTPAYAEMISISNGKCSQYVYAYAGTGNDSTTLENIRSGFVKSSKNITSSNGYIICESKEVNSNQNFTAYTTNDDTHDGTWLFILTPKWKIEKDSETNDYMITVYFDVQLNPLYNFAGNMTQMIADSAVSKGGKTYYSLGLLCKDYSGAQALVKYTDGTTERFDRTIEYKTSTDSSKTKIAVYKHTITPSKSVSGFVFTQWIGTQNTTQGSYTDNSFKLATKDWAYSGTGKRKCTEGKSDSLTIEAPIELSNEYNLIFPTSINIQNGKATFDVSYVPSSYASGNIVVEFATAITLTANGVTKAYSISSTPLVFSGSDSQTLTETITVPGLEDAGTYTGNLSFTIGSG